MDIELYAGATKAIISTKGGYVTNLSDDRGDILFPKRTLTMPDGSEKTRGGCHVCLPNFGPGGASGLEQHGYGRTSEWRVVEQSETRVELTCEGMGEYMSMDSFLTYEVHETGFTIQLRLKNKGESPLNVAPDFHPYFYRNDQAPVIDGEAIQDLAPLAATEFIDGPTHQVDFGRGLRLHSSELTHWAVWTDQLGAYLCVEPTQSGNAFADDISRADTLAPGEEKTYNFTIKW